jgi:phospholipid/cholesterol/gamma-HCH transport system permease protein
VEIEQRPEQVAKVTLRGALNVDSTAACWRKLEEHLRPMKLQGLDVDVSQLALDGGVGVALLRYVSEGGMTPGAQVSLVGLSPEQKAILETFTAHDLRSYQPRKSKSAGVPEELGSAVRSLWQDLREQVIFIGTLVRILPGTLLHYRRWRWMEVKHVIESGGANALPIIATFSWLVGLVLGLEAAHPLQQFGAQLYIADMVGFSSIRDTGPLVTAIMLAGRSSSAFAAELGTMKVNQELDALTTMGLSPIRFLVVPRIIGMLLLTPILSVYAMLMGIVGGLTVLRFLGFPPLMIWHEITARVHLHDLEVGLVKSIIFGLIVGAVGCLRGLQTAEGPQAVGVSTTRSVVASILLVILANTLVAMVTYALSL